MWLSPRSPPPPPDFSSLLCLDFCSPGHEKNTGKITWALERSV